MLNNLLKKLFNKETILYLVFGVLSTVINIAVCGLLFDFLHWDINLANTIAWTAAVIFAFITNKLFVFNSKTTDKKIVLKETVSFFIARVITFLICDMLITWLMVDIGHINIWITKFITNMIVIVMNYIFSKLFIFNHKQQNQS